MMLTFYATNYTIREPDSCWVNCGCGYRHRVPAGFFRFVIIRNRGQNDRYQAFLATNDDKNDVLFAKTFTIEDLQHRIGGSWHLLPSLRNLTEYTWNSRAEGSYCVICKHYVEGEDFRPHYESHAFVCRSVTVNS